ncbi:hypothetical protein BJX64DRAFT_299409 [Aspergillus heterothallicus]
MSNPPHRTPLRRRPLACVRCQRRKVRCDSGVPACSNCAKAGVECVEGQVRGLVSRNRLYYLEQRVRELETGGSQTAQSGAPGISRSPVTSPHLDSVNQISSAADSPAVSDSSRRTCDQPLVHDVGLLSLTNTTDPKYLGPSSGVTFARLVYESVPQTQGLPLSFLQEERQIPLPLAGAHTQGEVPGTVPIELPSLIECQQYAAAYFEATTLYPFISPDTFYSLLGEVQQFNATSAWSSRLPLRLVGAQLLLVLSLGARLLETRLGADYSSRTLFMGAMSHFSQINLHDTTEGVQILLLLVLHSFYSPEALNAWHLLHTIIACCLDLGLQRQDSCMFPKATTRASATQRSAVFWCAYSMDRTLTTILGRPLTLRDEAIDQNFPGTSSNEVEGAATQWHQSSGAGTVRDTTTQEVTDYLPCIYSLRFDRIVAEIKLMIYRVSRSPRRFPWPDADNLASWQAETENACRTLLEEIQSRQQGQPKVLRGRNPLSGVTVQRLEVKYHQCIMLLYRPSPQIPHPSPSAIQACFKSAMQIIQVYADLHRFSNLECSWLSAHSIFVAAITVLYYLWTYPAVSSITSIPESLSRAEIALDLLSYLSKWWSVAQEPCRKLSRLITMMREGPSQGTLQAVVQGGEGGSALEASKIPDPESRSLLIDELGVLRDLFDLGWLNDWGLDATQPPNWDPNFMAGFDPSDQNSGLNM